MPDWPVRQLICGIRARIAAEELTRWWRFGGHIVASATMDHGYALDFGMCAADPQVLASFWAFALGYVKEPGFDEPENASIIDPEGRGPAIGFLRVPEGKTAKNRMHIDIRVAGEGPWDMAERERLIRATVPGLQAAGARILREEFYGQVLGHVVMQDPEGNEFCVA